MLKLIYFYILLITALDAKEPLLTTLVNVVSNGTQQLSVGDYSFFCVPYGILTLEKLYNNSKINSTCQKKVQNFYIKHPYLEYYSSSILYTQQMYHIEFKGKECVLYAKGQKILSEILLEEGLAVKQPLFEDEEFKYLFFKAQSRARMNKKGLWEEDILSACIDSLH